MSRLFTFVERTFWGIGGLALSLIILFAVLHMLKQNAVTGAAAGWVGSHATNY